VFGDLLEIAGQQFDGFVNLGALVLAECRDRRGRRLLQFVKQLDRQMGEVVDEVEWVLDLVGDPGG
jgi:hypothetical protein